MTNRGPGALASLAQSYAKAGRRTDAEVIVRNLAGSRGSGMCLP